MVYCKIPTFTKLLSSGRSQSENAIKRGKKQPYSRVWEFRAMPNMGVKNDNFQLKNFDIFLIFAQNIYCGYTLEPPK